MQKFAIASAVALLAAVTSAAQAGVVYDTTGSDTNLDQQFGNNYYYIGDSITIASGITDKLTTVTLPFAATYYEGSNAPTAPFSYTPNLRVDIYASAADAASNTNLLGTASVSDVTFNHDGTIPVASTSHYSIQDKKNVVFDFSSQNLVLPTSFAIAYRDDGATSGLGANGLSSFFTANPTGTSFYTYPNSAASDVLVPQGPYTLSAQIAVAPEPATLAAVAAGALVLLGRRRRKA